MSKNKGPRILIIDIETAPNLGYIWGLFKQNIALSQLKEVGRVISFAAKWHGESKVHFWSDYHDGHKEMVEAAWEFLDQADMIVHYNGNTFDIPHLNREFFLAEMPPPSPHKNIDLLQTNKRRFRFASNKLDHVTQQIGLVGKLHHTGFVLWEGCLKDDPASWALMKRYNIQDVKVTEQYYNRVLPWIANHPHVGLYSPDDGRPHCSRCGGNLTKQGTALTQLGTYQQYKCVKCSSWSRGKKALTPGLDARGIS